MKPLAAVGRALCALPMISALVACGGAAPELALDGPSSVALVWGGSEAIALTLERNETATGDLTLSVEGLPAGVTARFEPETVAGDALSATLHLEASRDASTEAALVTIRATGPESLAAEHPLLLQVSGLTVTGSLVSAIGDRPPVGVGVKVGTEWVATDGNGTFVAHDVAVPYDLVIRGPLVTEVYQGLSTPTPRVTGFIDQIAMTSQPTIELNLTITPTPATGERVMVCANTGPTITSTCSTLLGNGAANTVLLSPPLSHDPAAPRQLVARRYTAGPDWETTGFSGQASVAIPYGPGQTVSMALELAPASSSTVPFSVEMPAGMPSATVRREGRVAYGEILDGDHRPGADVFHLPEGAAGAISISLFDASTGVGVLTFQPVSGPLEGPITFLPPLPAVSPADGASLTPETVFQTADPQGALVSHVFAPLSGGRILFVHTFEDRVSFSDLQTHVEDLRAWDISQWIVLSMPQVTTPEQAAEELIGYLAYNAYSSTNSPVAPNTGRVQMTQTVPRTFNLPVGASSVPSIDERLEALLPR